VTTPNPDLQRLHLQVNGIVQGVGFRPFVYNLATELGLVGWVTNTSSGVDIEIEGQLSPLRQFRDRLEHDAPPLSLIASIDAVAIPPLGESEFRIQPSDRSQAVRTLISPDAAICPDCLREMNDPQDRRYHYPFINCTNCGPRYTIIRSIPYDRPYTTMAVFTMCPNCQAEYEEPHDRRFHAQPNACPVCGPQLDLWDAQGQKLNVPDPIEETMSLIRAGKIVAIKGLGGFHLAVDAGNDRAVRELRRRKGRDEKPFALMARDVSIVRELCHLTDAEERFLTSPRAPILLLRHHGSDRVALSVAPGNDRLGVMLPYTPLHHLLLAHDPPVLVMTSANLSEEPICIDNQEAVSRLNGIADAFLVHNRDIYLRSDDSVWIFLGEKARPIRRSRGFVPQPIFVRGTGPVVLGVGAELKNTVCLLTENQAILSQHIGDLKNLEALTFFEKTIAHLETLFEVRPEVVVADRHPQYLSTQWARRQTDIPVINMQHHHTHLAALLAEHQWTEPVIGVILDGTGLGTDGQIWGGEVLVGTIGDVRRMAHLEPMPLPGGDGAIKHPWRIAVAYLAQTFGASIPDLPFLRNHSVGPILEMVEKSVNTPLTTSCGRLFDAVAALTGGCQTIRYEAQAAIEFMQIGESVSESIYRPELQAQNGVWTISVRSLIQSVVRDIRAGRSPAVISGRFHRFILDAYLAVVQAISQETGIKTIGFSGGVFQNQILLEAMVPAFERHGFQVLTHEQVPCNDGGLALGQAMYGRMRHISSG